MARVYIRSEDAYYNAAFLKQPPLGKKKNGRCMEMAILKRFRIGYMYSKTTLQEIRKVTYIGSGRC